MSCRTQNAISPACLKAVLKAVLCVGDTEPPVVRWTLELDRFTLTIEGDFMAMLPDDKTMPATVSYQDAKGNAASVEGAPVWASANESVATVLPAADGLSAVISPVGLGSTDITVTADADLGAGVVNIISTGTVEVVAGQAVTGVIEFGTPT